MVNIKIYRNIIVVSTFALLVIGVFMVRESSLIWAKYLYNDENYYFKRQLLYAIIGVVVFFVGFKINLNYLKKHTNIFLLFSLLLLILVIIPGIGITKNGSTSWLGFSFISFQPSEFFKLSLVIFLSKYLEKNYSKTNNIKTLIGPLLISIAGLFLIMIQPDFGTCMVLALSIFVMLYATKLSNKWFVFFIVLGISAVGILIGLESYRFERILSFIDPFSDPLGSGFQIIQSLYALGPGGLVGNMESIQKYYYLPEPQTDFIFAIFVEEFGLIGGVILIAIYALIIFSSIKIIKYSSNLFKSLLSLGLLSLFSIQVIINLGVVIGLFPVTGITLPLISYGGSSLIVVLFSLGIIVNNNYEKNIAS